MLAVPASARAGAEAEPDVLPRPAKGSPAGQKPLPASTPARTPPVAPGCTGAGGRAWRRWYRSQDAADGSADGRVRLGAGHQHGLFARDDAAAALPPLSPRRPFRSAKLLLGDRRWLTAFAAETAGWLMYVAALRLAPLALVQAVAASGVAVLAFATARGHPSRLARHEQAAVVLAVAGLVLLALSLVSTAESDHHPQVIGVIIWLAACGGGAALLIVSRRALPAPHRSAWQPGCYSPTVTSPPSSSATAGVAGRARHAHCRLRHATSVLQWATQRGDALTAACMATMATNAVPIAAGFVLFGEFLRAGRGPSCRSRRSPAWSRRCRARPPAGAASRPARLRALTEPASSRITLGQAVAIGFPA